MGCSISNQVDDEIQLIQSERILLLSQYSSSSSSCQQQPFKFVKLFSQGICITDMKKESVFVQKPEQSADDDPIFLIENESLLMIQSLSQSHSSKGILKLQKDSQVQKKKVRFDQEISSNHSEDAKKRKKKKLKRSKFV